MYRFLPRAVPGVAKHWLCNTASPTFHYKDWWTTSQWSVQTRDAIVDWRGMWCSQILKLVWIYRITLTNLILGVCNRSILNEHLEKCEFEIIGCPIGNSERCQNIKRGELGKHISYECPERKVSCKLCSELMSFSMLDVRCCTDNRTPLRNLSSNLISYQTHLKKSCPQQDVECKYCFAKYKRKEESAHLIQCPEVPVECPFADFGCKTKVRNPPCLHGLLH